MRYILTAALCALALLPRVAEAACSVTTGPLALTKIRLGDPGNVWVDCVNRSFDVLSASVPVSGTTTPSFFGPIYTPEIGGRATGTYGIKVSSPLYTLSGGPYFIFRTSGSVEGAGGFGVTYGLTAGSVTVTNGLTASSVTAAGAGGVLVTYGVSAATGVFSGGMTASSANVTGAAGLTVAYGFSGSTAVLSGGVTASSGNITGPAGLTVAYGVVGGTVTASSITLNGAGGTANAFNLVTSTGIRITAGYLDLGPTSGIRWPGGTISTYPATGGGGSSFVVGFDSSTQLGSLSFPGSGATANNVCVARSTLTVTGHGCPVQVIFNAPVSECNSNQQMRTSFLLNGAFVSGISAGVEPGRAACAGTGVTANGGFDVKIPAPSAGTLDFCAIAYSSVGNFESGASRPQFRVVELCNISN